MKYNSNDETKTNLFKECFCTNILTEYPLKLTSIEVSNKSKCLPGSNLRAYYTLMPPLEQPATNGTYQN